MSQFLNSVNEVRKNYKTYDAWEQKQADERAKKEYLSDNLKLPPDKVDITANKAKVVIRATEILDKRSEDNCENTEQIIGLGATAVSVTEAFALPPLFAKYYHGIKNKLQAEINTLTETLKKGSLPTEKVALLNKKLEGLKNNLGSLIKNHNIYSNVALAGIMLLTGAFFALWGTSKQKEASRIGRFQAKQNELKDLSNFVIYTPEQTKKAEEIAKNIPYEADKNSIVETFNQVKEMAKDKKAYKKWLKEGEKEDISKLKLMKFSPEQLQAGKEEKELIVDAVKEINIKAEEYSENLENSYDTLGTISWVIALPLGVGINKLLKLFKVSPKVNKITSFAVPLLTSLAINLKGTFEQKKAARVGRYIARQDLLKNPARLMAFSDEEMQKAKDVKAQDTKKGFWKNIFDSFAFLGTYHKDYNAYKKHKETEQKETERRQKAFKQIDITDAQKKAAISLKKNFYKAFDEIDEMSQRYSEDVEAACDISRQAISQVWTLGTVFSTFFGARAVRNGTFPLAKIANTAVNIAFKEDSELRKSINNIYSILKKDKELMKGFQKALVKRNLKQFLLESGSNELNGAVAKLVLTVLPDVKKMVEKKDYNVILESVSSQLKDGKAAKWARNLIEQSTKLYARSKLDGVLPEEVLNQMKLYGWKNYKTLIKTGGVFAVPALGVIFGVPYSINSWFTGIQKKAGKIGIMQAMEKLDDDRVFAPSEPVVFANITTQKTSSTQTNLLQKFDKKLN